MKVKHVSSKTKQTAKTPWKKVLHRSIPLAAISLMVMTGVFMLNIGYAISPVMTEEHKKVAARLQTAATKTGATKAAAANKLNSMTTPPAPNPTPAQPAPQPSAPAPAPAQPWPVRELYVNPHTDAANQARVWAASNPADAAVMAKIAAQPHAMWFGDWNSNLQAEVSGYVGAAAAARRMPVLVAYNIPSRDCGSYSAGGAAAAADYSTWIQKMVAGIAGRPAVVILEPDALPQLDCLKTAADRQARITMLQQAVTSLKTGKATYVYLDAGNSGWHSAATMAPRLIQAGIGQADGFSLNVSNFYTTNQSIAYGTQLSGLVGGKHFVVDTSRNGNGAWQTTEQDPWCNPPGRALGSAPSATATGSTLVDALLWIKTPGQSDGSCRGGPAAGAWWPEYALGLARAVGW